MTKFVSQRRYRQSRRERAARQFRRRAALLPPRSTSDIDMSLNIPVGYKTQRNIQDHASRPENQEARLVITRPGSPLSVSSN